MFKNTYQSGLLTIFYSCGSNPLAIWDMEVQNGHIKRLTDKEVNSIVLEIVSTNVSTTFITCPKKNQVLGIKLPFLVMILKNLKRYFSFEITVLDDKHMRRRFRISNFQSTTNVKPFCTSMPIGLSGGWNQIQFNLADFTRRAYGTHFIETLRVQVNANARLRRIYFSERLYTEEELPQDYKLFLPLEDKQRKKKLAKNEERVAAVPTPSLPQRVGKVVTPEQVTEKLESPAKDAAITSPITVTPTVTDEEKVEDVAPRISVVEAPAESTEPLAEAEQAKEEIVKDDAEAAKENENVTTEEQPSEEPPVDSENLPVEQIPDKQ